MVTLTACDGLFGLTHIRNTDAGQAIDAVDASRDAGDAVTPVQAVQASSLAGNGTAPPLSIQFLSSTLTGNAVVLACAIGTSNTHLSGITDDSAGGANVWMRVVDSSNWTSGPGVRLEVWYTTTGRPISSATVQYAITTDQRPLVCELIEWPRFAGLEGVNVQPPSMNKQVIVSSGSITTTRPSVLVGIVGTADPVANAANVDAPFTSFGLGMTVNGTTMITSDVVWAVRPPGPIEARWMLQFGQNWDAGLVAFGLR
ncbi:MAG TPA: hypothetical protein VMZ53_05525 [Kofleriaceae bacterium]|nr:hypothetical protein [Kofleriaceae bacterium]